VLRSIQSSLMICSLLCILQWSLWQDGSWSGVASCYEGSSQNSCCR